MRPTMADCLPIASPQASRSSSFTKVIRSWCRAGVSTFGKVGPPSSREAGGLLRLGVGAHLRAWARCRELEVALTRGGETRVCLDGVGVETLRLPPGEVVLRAERAVVAAV